MPFLARPYSHHHELPPLRLLGVAAAALPSPNADSVGVVIAIDAAAAAASFHTKAAPHGRAQVAAARKAQPAVAGARGLERVPEADGAWRRRVIEDAVMMR